jgi:hypothetical protein
VPEPHLKPGGLAWHDPFHYWAVPGLRVGRHKADWARAGPGWPDMAHWPDICPQDRQTFFFSLYMLSHGSFGSSILVSPFSLVVSLFFFSGHCAWSTCNSMWSSARVFLRNKSVQAGASPP